VDFNYAKIKAGNFLYRYAFPLYRLSYYRFKQKNDRDEIILLRRLITPGMVVYDIGANIGFYAILLAKMAGHNGKVICFEPDARNFGHLEKAVQAFPNVTSFQKAVSDKDGILKIYRSKLLNVDHRTYPVNNYESVEEIQAVSIDSLLRQRTIPAPDVIKIDIQGYELSAFKGMEQLLREKQNLKIVAEYWPHGFKRAGTSAVEFYDFFFSLGYRFSLIEADGLKPLGRAFVERNNDQVFEFSFNVLITRGSL
jgi:FkbM family methyltransferase